MSVPRLVPSAATRGWHDQVAGLAQLVEHLICNQGVGGSSPSAGTTKINNLDCGKDSDSLAVRERVSTTLPLARARLVLRQSSRHALVTWVSAARAPDPLTILS